jgi:phosphomannomutase/phosphoglucomutase
MNKSILREYDIRGVVGEDITEEVALELGKSYGTYMVRRGSKTVTVGRDGRLSSESFQAALIEGIVSTGIDVIDIGLCPSPVLYFSLFNLGVEGGVIVTASHNPPEFNGFKVCAGKSTIFGDEIQELGRIADSGEFERGKGRVTSHDIVADYKQYVQENIRISRPIKVAVDGGNGTAGIIAVPIMRALGCEVTELYCEVDGTFPNHHPDPTLPENLTDLIAEVTGSDIPIGVAYDGDGDRLGVIDERGDIIWGDRLLIIFSRELLKEHAGAMIIGEVKCSQHLYDDIEKHGGEPLMWKTGHSLIKDKMKETSALLAGEMSGHLFFADRYFGYDDAIYASLRLLEILARTGKTPRELLADVPESFVTPEIRVDCPEEKKSDIVEGAKEFFSRNYEVNDVDGARIKFAHGWGLVRASNTQPVLVMRFEADSQERLEEIKSLVESKVAELSK